MRVQYLLPLAAMMVLAGCQPSVPPNPVPPPPAQRPPDPAVVAKLQELITLRQEMARVQKVVVTSGIGNDYGEAEIAFIATRLRLARERGQRDQALAELRNIVAVHQEQVKILEARAVDRLPRTLLDQQRAKQLEAEIEFLREKAAMKGETRK